MIVALPALFLGCGARARKVELSPAPGLPVVAIRATEFAFTPDTIHLPAGRAVRVEYTNAGQIEHDVLFKGMKATDVRQPASQHSHGDDVGLHAGPGKLVWVEFTPAPAGTYELVCTFLGHTEAGMRGTLIVEPQ